MTFSYKFNNKEFDNKNWDIINPLWYTNINSLQSYYENANRNADLGDIITELNLLPFTNVILQDKFRLIFYDMLLSLNYIGSCEEYIYLLKLFFGEECTIVFDWVSAGHLRINVSDVEKFKYQLVDQDGNKLVDHEGNILVAFFNVLNLNDKNLKKLVRDITPAGGFCELIITL